MSTQWKILEKYDFALLPGEPQKMPDGDYSYYQYLNKRWQETGKNVLCINFLLKNNHDDEPKIIVEPFGGCGVFSVAIQHILAPSHHVIGELDDDCISQLNYCMSDFNNVIISKEDAHERLGVIPADIYVCDFPFFTLIQFENGKWNKEMDRMISHEPEAILITDGSSCRWHFTVPNLIKRGYSVTSNRESYASIFSSYMEKRYGYIVTAMAYHGTCFYIKLQPSKLKSSISPIQFNKIEAGEGYKGLHPVKENSNA